METVKPNTANESTTPWKPAQILDVKPIPGFRLRWVRKDNLEKSKTEGWIPIEAKDYLTRTIIDGTPLGTYVTKRNLILCKMPEAMAKGRDAYFAAKSKEVLAETKRKFVDDAGGKGLTYSEFEDESKT